MISDRAESPDYHVHEPNLYLNLLPRLSLTRLLSILGLLNGGIWFGTNFFMMFAVASFLSGARAFQVLGEPWSGVLLVVFYKSFFVINAICSILALSFQTGEWIWLAKKITRRSTYMVILSVAVGLVGVIWIYPTLQKYRLAANVEIQNGIPAELTGSESISSSSDDSPARDEKPVMKASNQKFFSLWRNIAYFANLFFLLCSGIWITRYSRYPTSNRPFSF